MNNVNSNENVNNKYPNVISALELAREYFFNESNINLTIDIMPIAELNAQVFPDNQIDDLFHIEIFSQFMYLPEYIRNITRKFDDDDYSFFEIFEPFRLYKTTSEGSSDYTPKDKVIDILATAVLYRVFFHECGHIVANHVPLYKFPALEYGCKTEGSYARQEKELIADWLGTKHIVRFMFETLIKNEPTEPTDDRVELILKQIVLLYWLSITLEFQIFESIYNAIDAKSKDKITIDDSKRTHPPIQVRFYYCLEALIEATNDLLVDICGNKRSADIFTHELLSGMQLIIYPFLSVMDVPICKELADIKNIEYYVKLRNMQYDWVYDERQCQHLMSLADSYVDIAKKCLSFIN